MRKALCVLTIGLLAGPVFGARERADDRKVDVRLELLRRAQSDGGRQQRPRVGWARELVDRLQPPRRGSSAVRRRLPLLVRHDGDRRTLERVGLRVQAQIGSIYAGTLAAERLAALAAVPGVRSIQLSQELRASRAPLAAATRVGVATARPLSPPPSAGAPGVIVAFIDTGVDIRHHDFRKADGTTRIKALLDLSDPGDLDGDGDLDGPGPHGGTLYTEAQINEGLAGSAVVRQKDTTGHGTHGLSVAAGDEGPAPGPASTADLVVVKATRDTGTLSFTSADVVAALDFVDDTAASLGLPYVVNLSLGTIFGPHDGRSLEEQAIDTLVGPGRAGKVAVVAAGNSSDNRSMRFHHARGTSYVGLTTSHTLAVPAYVPAAGQGNDRILLDAWYEGGDRLALSVTPPGGTTLTAAYGTYVEAATAQGSVFIANLGGVSPENGDTEAIVLVDDWNGTPPAAGNWTIAFTGEGIESGGEYHLWLADDSSVGGQSPHFSAGADNLYLVGKPGGAFNAITVGSYAAHDPASPYRIAWTDVNTLDRVDTTAVCDLGDPVDPGLTCEGDISDFSSPGGTRDGRIKPDVAAPGERVRGAVSRDALPGVAPASIYRFHPFAEPDALLVDDTPDRAYGLLQGTSFAAPVVTGLAARILSEDPTLDAVQVRNVLVNSVQPPDVYTGALPNDAWGHGRVDLGAGLGSPLPSDLRIEDQSLPAAVVGRPYSHVFTGSGGTLAYTWSSTPAPPVPGLTLDTRGFLSGTPTAAGAHTFTVQVVDSSVPAQTASRPFTLQVDAAAALYVVTEALPPAALNHAYDESLEAAGGTPPYTWSLAGGDLPDGLALGSDGRVTGTPTALGQSSFTVQVQDAVSATALRSVRLKVTRAGSDAWDPLGVFATRITQLVVDPADPDHLFCSTEIPGTDVQDAVFESTDAGESWTPISINNGFNTSAQDLALGPTSTLWAIRDSPEEVMYYDPLVPGWTDTNACGGTTNVDAIGFGASGAVLVIGNVCGSNGAVRRSIDNGATWSTVGTLCGGAITDFGRPGSISVSPTNPSVMYATRSGSISSLDQSVTCGSTNGGATWTQLGSLLTGEVYFDVQVSSTDAQDVVRAVEDSPFTIYLERSTDGGATWTRYGTGSFGFFSALRRSPSDPAVLLLGTSQELRKSADHGQTWTELTVKGRPSIDVNSIAFDPLNADKFYVGTTQGIFYTADGGATWAQRNRGLVRIGLTGVAQSAGLPGELLLATTGGTPYLTRTAGERWAKSAVAGSQNGDLVEPVISAADPRLYLIGTPSGLQRSENRGLTWVASGPSCAMCSFVSVIAADPFAANVMLVEVSGGDLFRSADRGATWTQVGWALPAASSTDIDFAHDVPGRAWAALGSYGLHRSDDGGITWVLEYDPPPVNGDIDLVEPAPSDSRYVYATGSIQVVGGGPRMFYKDADTGVWSPATTNPPAEASAIAVEWSNPLVAYAGMEHPGTVGTLGGIFKTVDGGRNWARVPGILDGYSVVQLVTHPTSPGSLLAATREGGVFRSTDFGATWRAVNRYGTIAELVNMHVLQPGGTIQFAATEGYGVQKSTDGGVTFTPVVNGLANLNVHTIAFDPDTPTTLYAGTDAGIYKSTDAGATWSPTAQATGRITDLATHNDGSTRRIWGTVSGQGVAYSSDGGVTFQVHNTGLSSLELTSLEIETVGTTRRIWGTTRGGDGVVFSDDDGLTWTSAAGAGLSSRNVNDFTYEKGSTRRIWGTTRRIWGTTDDGVFFSDNDGLSWTEMSLGLPTGVPVTSIAIDPNTQEALVSLLSDREGGVYRGGNVTGVWSAFTDGLDELQVRRVTHDRHTLQSPPVTASTRFFAATAGDGSYESVVAAVPGSALTITTSSLPSAPVQEAYTATLAATGGTPPYTWSVMEGFLPPGLELDAASGVISGTPTQLGTWSFDVQVADSGQRVERRTLAIVVANAGVPDLVVGDVSVTEGNAATVNAVFTVSLSAVAGVDVTVDYATANGTATTAGGDYVLTQGTLTIPAGQTQRTVTVAVNGDVAPEDDETFFLQVANVVGAHVADHQGQGIVVDDDRARLGIGDASVTETDAGTVTASFPVTLSGTATGTVTVDYATADGTAISASAGTGANASAITIPSSGNATPYPSSITLSAPGTVTRVTATLTGLTHSFTQDVDVLLVAPSGQGVILVSDVGGFSASFSNHTITLDDTAPTGLPSSGSVTSGTYKPTNVGAGDAFGAPAPSGPYGSTLSAFNGTTAEGTWKLFVVDDFSGGSGSIAGGWSLSVETSGDFVATSGTLTFPLGTTSRTINVTVNSDNVAELTETFSVNLTNPVQANLGDAVGTGTIVDDDGPPATVNDVTVTEGTGGTTSAVFTVTVGPGALPATVSYATSAGTATSGSDFQATSGTLSFAASGSPRTQTITVPIVTDASCENDETFTVVLSNASGAVITDATGVGTIDDDEPRPAITIGAGSASEGDTTLSFPVTLSPAPGEPLTIGYSTANGTALAGQDYTAATSTIGFAAGVTTGVITVDLLADTLDEADETFTVTVTPGACSTVAVGTATGTILDDDPTPSLSIGDVTVTEGSGGTTNAVFTVTLGPGALPASVGYTTAGGTATTGSDFQATSATLNFAGGATPRTQTITVPVVTDAACEDDETFSVVLSNATGATIADGTGIGTIQDDDTGPAISVGPASGSESGGTLVFPVTLSAAPLAPLTIGYSTADGTATAGQDYTAASSSIEIPAGSTSGTITIALLGDTLDEADETFTVTVTPGACSTVTVETATGTIQDDDPTPSLSIDDVTVTEGSGGTTNAVFTVTLGAGARQASVGFTTAAGTAAAGSDFQATSGTLDFPPSGSPRTQTITVPVVTDATCEDDETFSVVLSSPSAASIADGTGVGTIDDDEPRPAITVGAASAGEGAGTLVFPVTLSPAPGEPLTIGYATANGTALAGQDYAAATGTVGFAPGATEGTITVTLLGDSLDEADETFTVTVTPGACSTVAVGTATGTIQDDDPTPTLSIDDVTVVEGSGGTTNAVFTVTLGPGALPASVGYTTASGTATTGSDFQATSATLNFAGSATPRTQTITVPVVTDAACEDDETFSIVLSNATGATIADGTGIGTIQDDDTGPAISIGPATAAEGAGTLVFPVTLSAAPLAPLTIGYSTADGTATAGQDYTAASSTIEIAAGTTEGTITITLLGDSLDEADETFTVTVTPGACSTVAVGTATGTIQDDDPTPSVSIDDVTVTEGTGGTTDAIFTVTLGPGALQASVNFTTLPDTAAPGSDFQGTSGTLNFAPSTSARTQTITVRVTADAACEDSETFWLLLGNASGAAIADGTAVGTIQDDDSGPAISIGAASAAEGAGTLSFPVTLSAAPLAPLTIGYSTADGTATAGQDYTAASGTIEIPAGQTEGTITVTLLGDSLDEADETFTVTVTPGVCSTVAVGTATGTIQDDDPTPTLGIDDVTVTEGSGGTTNAVFTVTLGPGALPASVGYTTAGGTAAPGSDFQATSATLNFGGSATPRTQTITVPVVTDAACEDDEIFSVVLSSATGATIADNTGAGTIQDDDTGPAISVGPASGSESAGTLVFPVTLSAPPLAPLTIGYSTADGTATAGQDYTAASGTIEIPAGTTEGTITIPLLGDSLDETDETFTVTVTPGACSTVALGTATGTIVDDDPTPALSIDDVTVTEGSGGTTNAVFTVTLGPGALPATVAFTTTPGTASAGSDFQATSDTLSFSPSTSARTRTITVPVVTDAACEDDEIFSIVLSNATGATIADGTGVGTIQDDDTGPAISIGLATAAEGAGTLVFPVTLSAAPLAPLTIGYSTADGTATAGQDYTAASGTIEIPAGQTQGTITVTLLGDSLDEADETFTVTVTPGACSTVAVGTATGTIQDDDPTPSVSIDDVTVVEGSGGTTSAVFTVTLGPGALTATVDFTTVAGTASAGSDFQTTGDTLSFPPSASPRTQTITVPVVTDAACEDDETFSIVLSNATGATIADETGIGTIQDDDTGPAISIGPATAAEGAGTLVFPVTLSAAPLAPLTIGYSTADGTATAGQDYTAASSTIEIPAGTTEGTITIPLLGDSLDEADETFTVTVTPGACSTVALGTATGTIVDDDPTPALSIDDVTVTEGSGGTTSAVFTVTLGPGALPATVAFTTVAGTASAGSDFQATSDTLNFAGSATPRTQTITVPVVTDAACEDDETFSVVLSNATGATIADNTGAGTIQDDDTGPAISIGPATAAEGAGTLVFPVTLSAPPLAPLTIGYSTADGTATAGQDYTAASSSIEIPAGSTSGTITIALLGDTLDEADEQFTVTVSAGACSTVAVGSAAGTILDDDGTPSLAIDDVTVVEGSGGTTSAVFTVTVGPGAQTASVDFTTTGGTATSGADFQATSGELRFAPSGSLRTDTITVPVVTDTSCEADEGFAVLLSNASGAVIVDETGVGTIQDDDTGPAISIGPATAAESAGTLVFPVTLSAAPLAPLTIGYSTANGTAVAGQDYTAASSTIEIPAGSTSGTISIALLGDSLDEDDETFTVTVTPGACSTVAVGTATGTILDDDPTPGLSIDDVTVVEGSGGTTSAVFTVTLGPGALPATVAFTTAAGTASAGSDFQATSDTLNFAGSATPRTRTISVPVVTDAACEDDETFSVVLSNATGATIADNTGAGTIQDDDTGPAISIGPATAAEGAGTLVFPVTLSAPPLAPLTIGHSTADGTATAGQDYTAASGTIEIPAGQTEGTITVTLLGDSLDEAEETFTVTVTPGACSTVVVGTATGTIQDDDPTPGLSIDDVTVVEGSWGTTNAVFTVTLGPGTLPASVGYTTAGGTATPGSDFQTASDMLSFPPSTSARTRTITVPVVTDAACEDDETFSVVLSNATGATIADGTGIGTIQDDDTGPAISIGPATAAEGAGTLVFPVTLSTPPLAPLTIGYSTADGTATAGQDYTPASSTIEIPAGETEGTITVTLLGDALDENDETLTITVTPGACSTVAVGTATGTILDDDPMPGLSIDDVTVAEGSGGTTNAIFTVTLGPGTLPASVGYTTAAGTATPGSDFQAASDTLSFPPSTSPRTQTITVPVITDASCEEEETFTVQLSNPAGATIADGTGTGTIQDDDTGPAISIGPATAAEGAGTLVFPVTLSAPPLAPLTIGYSTADGTAVAGQDYTAASGTIEIAAGITEGTITIALLGDSLDEADETFTVTVTPGACSTVAVGTATGTILDDDPAPTLSIDDVTVTEGSGGTTSAVFTVTLGPGALPATVAFTTTAGTASAGSDFQAASDTLSFPPSTSPRMQIITVPVVTDASCEEEETFTVQLSNPTGATIADGTGTGTIQDDDTGPAITIGPTASAGEAQGTLSIPLRLSATPEAPLTIGYSTADGTAVAGQDYTAASGTIEIAAGITEGTITVTLLDDALDENDETLTVTVTPGACSTVAVGTATGTILDDDGTPSLAIDDVTVVEGTGGTTTAVFTVTLGPGAQPATVAFETLNVTATSGSDFQVSTGTLNFAAGVSLRTETITVPVVTDAACEDDETFTVQLSNPTGATIVDGTGTGTIQDDDTGPAISIGPVSAGEGAGTLVFPVTLSAAPLGPLTIGYSTADGTAIAGQDYTAASGAIEIPAGSTQGTITVTLLADALDEADETFTVTVTPGACSTVSAGTATGTIEDDDPVPALTIADAQVLEGHSGPTPLQLEVSLSAPSGREVTVQYATADGTATGDDYTAASGTLTFAPGEQTKAITVMVAGDVVSEEDEAFSVQLSSPTAASIADGAATAAVLDDDVPRLSISDASVVEGDAGERLAVFAVRLRAPAAATVTVGWRTELSGSAAPAVDYFRVWSDFVSFPPGVTARTLVVRVRGDARIEGDETFHVRLLSSSNGAVFSDRDGTGTIVDDDP